MKLKLRDIRIATLALNKFADKSFPAKMGYALSKNATALSRELEIIEKEREKICKLYADKDEKGEPIVKDNVYSMTSENENACNKEYHDLLDTETDVDIKTIPVSALELCDSSDRYYSLTLSEINSIDFMIEE